MRMIILLSMLMLCLVTGMPPAYYAHRIGDLAALLSFKAAVEEDPENHLSSWQIPQNSQSPSSPSPCNWFGVGCNNIGRVTALDLSHCNMSGPLPASALSNLDNLRTLNLSFNRFQGNISHLPRGLHVLDLSCNSVSDTAESLPSLLPPNLLHLNVSGNNFSGSVSLQSLLQHSPRLQVLDLSSNNLTGPVTAMAAPGTLPCSHLAILDLSANYLSGTIPPEISECGALRTLNLSSNQFTGPVPRSFNSLAMIETLDLSRNHLSGPIPPELGSCCRTLTHLFLSTNNISGTIPPSLSSCTLLRTLDLSSNNISSRFPDAVLGNLVSLERLILTSNFITGAFPDSVSACPRLQVVDFGSNFLSGQLPENICGQDSELAELRLPDNAMSGGIPAGLQHCRRLRTVDLSINNISGGIPAELGELPNLERFIAWFNHLRGPIPPELGRCRRLKNVILNNNDLSGGIPKSLAGCTDLEWIALSSNRISGRIPAEFGQLRRLSILQLANNSLSGEIPAELGNCSNLLWLDLNNNRLSGEIPRRLGRQTNSQPMSGILAGDTLAFLRNVGNACTGVGGLVEFAGITPLRLLQVPTLKDCQFTRLYSGSALNDWTHYQSLEYLDLSYNSLAGPIPAELGDMAALQVLELAHNNLSGTLPDSLGKLRNLGVFEASHNNLSGPIPQSFSNLTFLVQIDLSNNNLSGEIPSRGQLSTLPASQYSNNPLLCGVPLAACTVAGNFNPNTPDTGVPQKRAGIASWANSVVLGILVSMAFVCVLIIWAIAMRARQKEGEAAAILNSLHTSCNTTTWKLGKEKEPLSINVATFERPLRKLTFSTLIEATNGFCADSLVGSGGFGEVFKATLRDGSTVAIKKLIRLSCQGDREFMAEMETLGKIKHANLVPLLGYCKIGEERLLVYEYMPHGSLEDMLHGRDDKAKSLLTWPVRKEIARGAARGLAFLHHNCIPHVIHRDMKSSNVLLDARLQARVSDFGMARLISALDTHLTISALAGTPGYVPPEYYQSIRCTAKGDVYSYGVLLLELATGKRPTDKDDFGDTNLVGWVRMHLAQGRDADVVDPVLAEHLDDVLAHVRVAMQCLDDVPSRRPSMLQVVATFKALASANSDSSSPPAAPVTEAPAPR